MAKLTPAERSASARNAALTEVFPGIRAFQAAAYRSGRVRLGQAIERKRDLVAELEAELAAMGIAS